MLKLTVSIIVPVFNMEDYLQRTINSIVSQTYNHLEIILVNDGSTDNSPNIIDEYASKDTRIKAIHKENAGIGSAYKAAFKIMSGDYVLFVDSDDWLELNAVENLIELAMKYNADLISFGIRAFNTKGEEVTLPTLKNIDLVNTTNEAILKTHFEILKHPTLVRLYKRELFEGIVVFEQNIGIDELLTPQLLAKCNRAVYTSKIYYNLLIRQDSVSRSVYTKIKIEQLFRIYDFLLEYSERELKDYKFIYFTKYFGILIGIYLNSLKFNTYYDKSTIELLKNKIIQLNLKFKNTFSNENTLLGTSLTHIFLYNFPITSFYLYRVKSILDKFLL